MSFDESNKNQSQEKRSFYNPGLKGNAVKEFSFFVLRIFKVLILQRGKNKLFQD